jgi:hypothetical protein
MKVSEFIEWLKTKDQEATVKIVSAVYDYGGYTSHKWKEFDPDNDECQYELNGKTFLDLGDI